MVLRRWSPRDMVKEVGERAKRRGGRGEVKELRAAVHGSSVQGLSGEGVLSAVGGAVRVEVVRDRKSGGVRVMMIVFGTREERDEGLVRMRGWGWRCDRALGRRVCADQRWSVEAVGRLQVQGLEGVG